MMDFSALTDDELVDGICLRAGRIAAAEAELLLWIAEFDRRGGWAGAGLLSCAHWLSWRVGLTIGAAREQVRVARRLGDLPEVATAFSDGRVSYSKVRAMTRVAEPDDGIDWVELGRHSSAAQLEKIVRGVRRVQANEAAEADPEGAAWSLRTRVRYDDAGNFTLTISGPAQYLPVLQAGIEAKKTEIQRQRDAEAAARPASAPGPAPAPAPTSAPAPQPAPQPAPTQDGPGAPPDVSAETSESVHDVADPAAGGDDTVDLDAQAPGWPSGTTRGDVRATVAGFAAALVHRDDEFDDVAEPENVDEQPVDARTTPAAGRAPASAASDDVSAETSGAVQVSDADALLALALDALAAEQAAHPAVARRRRPQLTAHIDPLSGWGRLVDGELLPPSSLRTVMTTLPGRDRVMRLRPVTVADVRRHDLGRTAREAKVALRELLGTLDGERCRFPGCTRHLKLHSHHVVYWSNGGATDLDNLVKQQYIL
jgi:hypothetical protein